MAYFVSFSDPTKNDLQVDDRTLNQETSLKFPGRNAVSYGEVLAENLLHLLENFSSPTPPTNPVQGQIWFNTSTENKELNTFNGAEWVPSSGIYRTHNRPDNPSDGDMWIDNNTRRLFVFLGSAWVLIGTSSVTSEIAGVMPSTIIGRDNKEHFVLKLNLDSKTIAVIATTNLVPKSYMEGFKQINAGFNLNSSFFTSFDQIQYTGVTEKAKSLLIGEEVVLSGNFLRADTPNLASERFTIQSDDGLVVGESTSMRIGAEGQSGIIENQIEGSDIKIRLKKDGRLSTVLTVGNGNHVGINKVQPEYDLDVAGTIRTDTALRVENDIPSNSPDTGSIVAYGGIGVLHDVNVRGNVNVQQTLTANHILPLDDASTIGSTDDPFDTVTANLFMGNLKGNVEGALQGNALTANRLSSITRFRISGDLISNSDIEFDGEIGGTLKEFNTELSSSLISGRIETNLLEGDDELLVNSVGGGAIGSPGLRKITKNNFLNSLPKMPVGAVIPFAGTASPYGWVLCNGGVYRQSTYPILFGIIGYTYTLPTTPPGYFNVPDLRSRFPLGAGNMGGPDSGRVNNTNAVRLGGSAGSETIELTESNIPDHSHDLFSDGKQHYTVTKVGDAERYLAVGDVTMDGAYPNRVRLFTSETTGGTTTDTDAVQHVESMNPYLTLNYIIYTGER